MKYLSITTLKKRILAKKNYLAIVITLLLLLVLPLLLYGLSQIQNFTDHAGTIKLGFQSQLGSIKLDQTDITINEPTVLHITIPQKHGYDALAIKIDTRYLSDIKLTKLQDLFLIQKIEADNSILYLLSSRQFNKDLSLVDWTNELTIKKPTDSVISPTQCFPEYCTPDYHDQTVSLNLERKVNLHYTLKKQLTATQRPIQIIDYSLISNYEQAFYSFSTYLPKLKINQFAKNQAPIVISEPPNWAVANKTLTYDLKILDADNDKTNIFLECPDFQVCNSPKNDNPLGLSIKGHQLILNFLQASTQPYHINTYVTDSKATTKHSFDILVTEQATANPPVCEYFTTEYPIKTIAVGEKTPLTLLTKDAQGIKQIVVLYTNLSVDPNSVENTQTWRFNPPIPKINLTQYDKQPLAYTFKNGEYRVNAVITNQSGLTTKCYLRQRLIQSRTDQTNLAQQKDLTNKILTGPVKHNDRNINKVSFLKRIDFLNFLPPVQANNHQTNTVITGVNMPPTFTSDPAKDAPVNVVLGSAYTYSLTINDSDNDMLQHIVVTKPTWAQLQIISKAGDLQLNITGTPDKIGAHVFSFSITDGYNSHYITQTWVVNVENAQNDLPRITVTAPKNVTRLNQGERLVVGWQASDRQQITNFNIYLITNLAERSNRRLILGNLKYNVRSANINTRNLPAGRFYVLVEGKDNFNPPATGFGVSEVIDILAIVKPTITPTPTPVLPTPTGDKQNPTPTPTPTPTVKPNNPDILLLPLPVATNLLPAPKTEIDDATPLISASLQASNNATLVKNQIKLLLDKQDISSKIKISGDNKEKGAMSYLPTADLNPGQHLLVLKIKDSENKENTIQWTFIVKESLKDIDDVTDDNNDSTQDTIDLLGYTIPKQIAIFLGIGILVIIIALILPLLLFMTWRKAEPTPKTLTKVNPNQQPIYNDNLHATFDETQPSAPVAGIISAEHEMDKVYQQTTPGYPTSPTNLPIYEKISVNQPTTKEAIDQPLTPTTPKNNEITKSATPPPSTNTTDENVEASHVPDFMNSTEPATPNYPLVNPPTH